MCIHDHGFEWECSGCIANALELRWSYAGVCVVVAVWRCHRPLGRWRHGFHFIPYAMRKDSMKPISYKSSKAAAVCSVTSAPCVDFPLRYLMWFPNILVKKYMYIWIQQKKSQGIETSIDFLLPKILLNNAASTCCGKSWQSHRSYQLLLAPYQRPRYKHRQQDGRRPPQGGWPAPICTYTWLIQVIAFMSISVVCEGYSAVGYRLAATTDRSSSMGPWTIGCVDMRMKTGQCALHKLKYRVV